jgi:hypothetical protein
VTHGTPSCGEQKSCRATVAATSSDIAYVDRSPGVVKENQQQHTSHPPRRPRRQLKLCGKCNSSPEFEVGALVTAAWLEKGDECGFWYDGVVRNSMCKCSSVASGGGSANGSTATAPAATTWSYDIAFVKDGREDNNLAGVWVWSRQAYQESVATREEEGKPQHQGSDVTSSHVPREFRTWQCEFEGCRFVDADRETVADHERSCLRRPLNTRHLSLDDMHSLSQPVDAASAAAVTPPVYVADLPVLAAAACTTTGRPAATHAVQKAPVSVIASSSLSLNPAAAITNDSLPPGWSVRSTPSGVSKHGYSRFNRVYTSPTGFKCRTLKAVRGYVAEERKDGAGHDRKSVGPVRTSAARQRHLGRARSLCCRLHDTAMQMPILRTRRTTRLPRGQMH